MIGLVLGTHNVFYFVCLRYFRGIVFRLVNISVNSEFGGMLFDQLYSRNFTSINCFRLIILDSAEAVKTSRKLSENE